MLKILICDKIWVYYLIWIINRNWWDVVFEKSKIFRDNKEILEYKESVVIFFNRSGFCDNVGLIYDYYMNLMIYNLYIESFILY